MDVVATAKGSYAVRPPTRCQIRRRQILRQFPTTFAERPYLLYPPLSRPSVTISNLDVRGSHGTRLSSVSHHDRRLSVSLSPFALTTLTTLTTSTTKMLHEYIKHACCQARRNCPTNENGMQQQCLCRFRQGLTRYILVSFYTQ